ncbi:MAG TPA: hypothetical protein VIY08_05865 [Candidatus Nitrosocosmicus sp.]|jgi:hypothetical protein
MLLAYELNIAGLLFDIVGAIGIFKTKIIGLEKTSDTKVARRNPSSNINLEKKIDELESELNDIIDSTNLKNIGNDKKAKVFFVLIFCGFLIQVLASFINILAS